MNHSSQKQGAGRGGAANRQESSTPVASWSHLRFTQPLDAELFNNQAREAAQKVSEAERNRNKATQLRRFYDELVLWETRASQHPDRFSEYLPFIRMLNAKSAYAEGRKLVDRTFVDLLAHTLKQVDDAKTLTTCKLFWEAFMGFYKQLRGDN